MRYVTAALGAVFIFAAIIIISFFVNAHLPPAFQRTVFIPLGFFRTGGTPALLVGLALGSLAATHSFRGTLKRYAVKAEKKRCDDHGIALGSN